MKEKYNIKVKALRGDYSIELGWNILHELKGKIENLGKKNKIGIISNPKVKKLYYGAIHKGFHSKGITPHLFCIPDGERYKNLKTVEKLYEALIRAKFERDSILFALGGGVIGDVAGFLAATYLRGIPLVHIPTTLVAQVDSSIGGKTGVNHHSGKNLIGSFYSPKLVYTDLSTLKTLSRREYRGGLAEVVKYGVILDPKLFRYMENHSEGILKVEPRVTLEIVQRSCKIKAMVVSRDEREGGLRKILNYGHTLGHALETITQYKIFKHGEAIAIGMHFAACLSHYLGLCSEKLIQRQRDLLREFGLPTRLPHVSSQKLIEIMAVDKKVKLGKIYFVLPLRLGKVIVQAVERKHLLKVLNRSST